MKALKRALAMILSCLCMCFSGCGDGKEKPSPSEKDEGTDVLAFADNYEESILALCGKDDFGGIMESTGKIRKDKYVGLYYLNWFGEHKTEQSGVYNVNELLSSNPNALWNTASSDVSPTDKYYYWGEPLYGYYNSRDPWVIRRHIELLTYAGADFFCIDTTNGFAYTECLKVFLDTLLDCVNCGWPVPKVVLFTNTNSGVVTERHYTELYAEKKYENLWFAPHGKPMIINRDRENPEESLKPLDLKERDWFLAQHPEAANYFEFRASQWPQEQYIETDGFPWMDWAPTIPQGAYNGTWKDGTLHREWKDSEGRSTVSISVAQHTALPFSDSVQYPDRYNNNRGRGWDYGTKTNNAADVNQNANFCAQWRDVIDNFDPEIVHITGWNEWTALKSVIDNRTWFLDTTNTEFSRDLEMMKGGYGDNAYMQLAEYTREFKQKGVAQPQIPYDAPSKLKADFKISQWEDKGKAFSDFRGDAVVRDYDGICSNVHYTDESNRNDIREVRVGHDENNLYFLIRTEGSLKFDYSANNWMNLYIGVEGQPGGTFYDWQYLINRSVTRGGVSSVERSKGGYDWEKIGKTRIITGGNYVQLSVPKSLLGIASGQENKLYIKVTDNLQHPEDISDYYVSGDSAPIGRLSWTYYFK